MTRRVPRPGPAHPPFLFVGNLGWVDFVNTEYAGRGGPIDALPGPDAVRRWLLAAGLPAEGVDSAARDARLFAEARRLRGALAAMAAAVATGQPVPAASLQAVNRVLRAVVETREVRRVAGGFTRHRQVQSREPAGLLAPIAESAADFLCDGEPSRLRRCGNPRCVLYFYDTTRNRQRRFCSAATCGNLMKARERYRRLRAARTAGDASSGPGEQRRNL
jgi:predicted RNA-binding Zn ribbon-like protein